jgi:hypothetical protein
MRSEGGGTVPSAVAACVEQALGAESLPAADVAARISIRHLCGNTFEVKNSSAEPLELEYRVEGTVERGPFNLRGQSSETLVTDESGAVQLLYGGTVVAAASRGGAERCAAG